jgi:hypothetical protein
VNGFKSPGVVAPVEDAAECQVVTEGADQFASDIGAAGHGPMIAKENLSFLRGSRLTGNAFTASCIAMNRPTWVMTLSSLSRSIIS